MNIKIIPTVLRTGLFYGTTKVHKLQEQQQQRLEELTMRLIISNIGTATLNLNF